MWASKSLEEGRQGLISFIERQRPQGSARNQVTVVFDGKPGMYGFPVVGEVSVVFTEYETADDLIKYKVEEARNKKEIVVVTDDKQLLLYVRAVSFKFIWTLKKSTKRKNEQATSWLLR